MMFNRPSDWPKNSKAVKKNFHSLLLASLCSVLLSSCDYPVVPITPNFNSNIRTFKLKALVQNDNDDTTPDNFIKLEEDGMYNYFNLFCAEACCNLIPTVVLELQHNETGYLGNLQIEGNLQIVANRGSTLYGDYVGSGVRGDGQIKFNCQVTVVLSTGKFTAVNKNLSLSIEGLFTEQNQECIAYQILISGQFEIL
jgi:hypothetical protein